MDLLFEIKKLREEAKEKLKLADKSKIEELIFHHSGQIDAYNRLEKIIIKREQSVSDISIGKFRYCHE